MFRPSVVVVSVSLGLAVVLGSLKSSAVPECNPGEELVGDKCRAVCAPGTARSAQPPWACVSTAPVLTCKAGEEPVGDKCRPACAAGTARSKQAPWGCVSTAPVLKCKAGEEPFGDKCRALCPAGQTRNVQGGCTVTRILIGK